METGSIIRRVPLRRLRLTQPRLLGMIGIGCALLFIVMFAALCTGSTMMSPSEIFRAFFATDHPSLRTIVFDLRLPRVLLAAGVGGALAMCGVLFQVLLRNPLAEPYMLGVSNGCAVGAVLGYLIGAPAAGVTGLAFLCGSIVTLGVLSISRGSLYGERSDSMLLAGVMVGAIGAALLFLLLHFLGPNVRSAVQWMLGDLSGASATTGYGAMVLFAVLFGVSLFAGNALNALALGEQEAASLGLNVRRAQTIAYLCGSLVVGITVSFCGSIGFVGLVVPHILRRTIGADHRALLPLSLFAGGIFVVICDTISHSVMSAFGSSGSELPIGAITALVGAPVFIGLLKRRA